MILLGGLYSILETGTYFPPTYGLSSTFLGSFGGVQLPQNSKKTIFWLFWTISSTRMGLLIWLGACLQA
jgi:hypothetical protein